MYMLTQNVLITCDHSLGVVIMVPSQSYVSIGGRRVLVAPDPVGKPIAGCPNVGPTLKPCTSTLLNNAGYSGFVRISGRPVCMDTVKGITDGTPPGAVEYRVRSSGQDFVTLSG